MLSRNFPHPFPLFILTAILFGGATAGSASVEYNVRAYGATGDGVTLDSPAINRAIEAASTHGGGTVRFPAGDYLSYSIRLKSHITLQLDAGATLLAADPPPAGEPGGYDPPEPNPSNQYQDFGHTHWHNSLIWGEDLENISIFGPGRVFGRGLSQGLSRKSLFPQTLENKKGVGDNAIHPAPDVVSGPFGYPGKMDTLPAGIGNKTIALKNCRNVILRDFTILHGGHIGVLATGVDNLTIDNLTIDTNRDGIDIDACVNVRVSNCSINSPFDDALCLKSSHALGYARTTENVVITNCIVSGYDEGTLVDGTRQRSNQWPTGRIKLGTEANGGFRNITISNCVFEFCRGLALEQVDGGVMEDIIISNLTMRDIINAPIFVRLGTRLRGPEGLTVGTARRILISNIVAHNVGLQREAITPHGIFLIGTPGFPLEDIKLSNILIDYIGGGSRALSATELPEKSDAYPEPGNWGRLPSWGVFARHIKNLMFDHVELRTLTPDQRHAVILDDVAGARWHDVTLTPPAAGAAESLSFRGVTDLHVRDSSSLPNQ